MHIFEKKKNHEFAVTFPIYTYVILQGVYFDFTLICFFSYPENLGFPKQC